MGSKRETGDQRREEILEVSGERSFVVSHSQDLGGRLMHPSIVAIGIRHWWDRGTTSRILPG